jgi:flagellar export protein FliJ
MSDQKNKIKQIETLRRVREIRENQKKNILATTLQQQQVYIEQVKFLDNLRNSVFENIKEEQKSDFDLSQMMKYQMYLRQVHIKSIMASSTVQEIEKEVVLRRQDLIKANQQKVVSEKLLEKQKMLYREEADRQEAKRLDEIGSNIVQNKNTEEIE